MGIGNGLLYGKKMQSSLLGVVGLLVRIGGDGVRISTKFQASCHAERRSNCASRSSSGVEGPLRLANSYGLRDSCSGPMFRGATVQWRDRRGPSTALSSASRATTSLRMTRKLLIFSRLPRPGLIFPVILSVDRIAHRAVRAESKDPYGLQTPTG